MTDAAPQPPASGRGWRTVLRKAGAKARRFFLPDLAFLMAVLLFFMWLQTRGLLPSDEYGPDFRLRGLDGEMHALSDYAGRPILLYFFAPWCGVCNASADNLQALRESRPEQALSILMIALSYDAEAEVRASAERNGLTVPVLLGDQRLAGAYRIGGFPTYYVLDSEMRVARRDVGYSTELGLRLRSLGVD